MGCCQSDQSSSSRPSSMPLEPPQSTTRPLSISQQLLQAQPPTSIQLQCQQLLEALQSQHHTAESTLEAAEAKLQEYRKLVGEPPLFGLEWPRHVQEWVRGRRTDLVAEIRTLAELRKDTVLQWEADLKTAAARLGEEQRKEAAMEKEIPAISDSRRQNQAKTILAELQVTNAASQSTLEAATLLSTVTTALLSSVPQLLSQFQAFLWIDSKAKAEGIGAIDEVLTYDVEGENVEVYVKEEVEGEVAAEVQEESFSMVFDQVAEDKDRTRENALRKLYQRQREDITDYFAEEYIYEVMEAVIAAKAKADAESDYPAQSLDLFTLQYFLSLFPDSPIKAIVRLMNGLKALKEENRPFVDFYTGLFGVFTEKPLQKAVVTQLPFLSLSLTLFRQSGSDQRSLKGFPVPASPPLADLVHITDAAELIYRLLDETYQEGIGPALETLRPEKVAELDYVHFLLIHRMKYRDLDGISLFKYMAGANSSLTLADFHLGVRSTLKLTLSDAVLDQVYGFMRNPERETVHRVDFIKFLRLWVYHCSVFSREMMVERCRVLQALAQVYAEIRMKLVMDIRAVYRRFEDETGLLPLSELDLFLQSLGESRNLVRFQASIKRDKEKLDFQEVITLLERFQTQPYASAFFSKRY